MSLLFPVWREVDFRYILGIIFIFVGLLLSFYIFDTLDILKTYLPLAIILGIAIGIYFGVVFFRWNSRNDIVVESETDRKERIANQRNLVDFSTCMSCTKPISEEDEFCNSCGYKVGKHKETKDVWASE